MKEQTIVLSSSVYLCPGDVILHTFLGTFQVKRQMPEILSEAVIQLVEQRFATGHYSSDDLKMLDEHIKAGGPLPASWCSGTNAYGQWKRDTHVTRIPLMQEL